MTKKIAPKGSSEAFLRANMGFEHDYCLLWPYRLTRKGYGLAVIGGRQMQAHRWMCILSHGEPPSPEMQAAHICGNPNCVNPRHLRWATQSENQQDRVQHGTTNRGERDGMAKLSEQQVQAIIALKSIISGVELAEVYGVNPSAIYKIWRGERWAHLMQQSERSVA